MINIKEKVKYELWEWFQQEFKGFDNPGADKVLEKAIDLTLAEVGKEIDDETDIVKDIHAEVDNQLDVLRDDIRDNVESVGVDGKAFSRTSDIDNSIDAKEKEIKEYFKEKLEELKKELKQKFGIK